MSKIKVLDKNIHLVQDYLRSCSVDEKMLEAKAGFEEDFCEAAEELKELCEIKSMIVKSLIPSRTIVTRDTNQDLPLTKLDLLDEQLEMLKHNLVCYSSDLSLTCPKAGFEKSYEETRDRMELLLRICIIVEDHERAPK